MPVEVAGTVGIHSLVGWYFRECWFVFLFGEVKFLPFLWPDQTEKRFILLSEKLPSKFANEISPCLPII